jgi:hypothetical protein
MAMLAGFQLATAPAEPQASGVIVTNGINPSTYTHFAAVFSINFTIRPPDPGVGYAF